MIHQSTQYIKFLRRSKNQHGVHSPFVYALLTDCFYDKTKHPEYNLLKSHRNWLKKSKETIKVTDLGAGSRVFTSNLRAVSAIAKKAGMTKKRRTLLFRLSHYLQPQNSLELGTSVGIATVALAKGNSQGTVTTIEGCAKTLNVAKEGFKRFGLGNIRPINAKFSSYLEKISEEKFDLVFIDGNHTKEATLSYFDTLLQHKSNNTVLIFDDIYWSKQMTEAWEQIKAHPDVTVTIDTFQWGLVFFRNEQEKQHFTIRV